MSFLKNGGVSRGLYARTYAGARSVSKNNTKSAVSASNNLVAAANATTFNGAGAGCKD